MGLAPETSMLNTATILPATRLCDGTSRMIGKDMQDDSYKNVIVPPITIVFNNIMDHVKGQHLSYLTTFVHS
jgi:hypothetical protein